MKRMLLVFLVAATAIWVVETRVFNEAVHFTGVTLWVVVVASAALIAWFYRRGRVPPLLFAGLMGLGFVGLYWEPLVRYAAFLALLGACLGALAFWQYKNARAAALARAT